MDIWVRSRVIPLLLIVLGFSSSAYGRYFFDHQKISQMTEDQRRDYLLSVHKSLQKVKSSKVQYQLAFLANNDECRKQKKYTCHPGLYGENVCVKRTFNFAKACARASKSNDEYFKPDNGTARSDWASFVDSISNHCLKKKKNKGCRSLAKKLKKGPSSRMPASMTLEEIKQAR